MFLPPKNALSFILLLLLNPISVPPLEKKKIKLPFKYVKYAVFMYGKE